MRIIAALAALVIAAPLPTARADFPRLGIFRKKQKEEPPQRVKQLVETLKADPDEKKRQKAAGELRDHDPRTNPDILPTLINSLQRDPSPAVRGEVAETIGKLKPLSQTAGVALEQTLTGDPAEEVRKAAQQALWDYHLNGYRSAGANPAHPQTAEPPLAKPRPTVAMKPPTPAVSLGQPRPITSGIGKGAVYPQTIEPPLAKPMSKPAETVAPPTPSLTVPPVTKEEVKPAARPGPPVVTIPPPPAKDPTPAPSAVTPIPTPTAPTIPAAPTVPAGPTVPTIPPPK